MKRVMSARVERDMRAWVVAQGVELDRLEAVMNAIRRDLWDRDSQFRRAERAMGPFVEPGLFGVSHA